MSVRILQEASFAGENWWRWSVWLDGTSEELDAVDRVIYTLHPTFPNPVREIKDRSNQFRLDSAGWGEFEIHIEIVPKIGRIKKRKHWLRLSTSNNADVPYSEITPSKAKSSTRPLVFISSSITDTTVTNIIQNMFKKYGAEVINNNNNFVPGVPYEQTIKSLLEQTDIAIFIISGRLSMWALQELRIAIDFQVPHIVPVVIGDLVKLPYQLQSYNALYLKENDEEMKKKIQAVIREWLGKY